MSTAARASAATRMESWIRWLAAVLKARRLEDQAILLLHAMSDRELKDMGVVRSHIEFAIRGGDPARQRSQALGPEQPDGGTT